MNCQTCHSLRSQLAWAEIDFRGVARKVSLRPDDEHLRDLLTAAREYRDRMVEEQRRHEASCTAPVVEAPRPVKDVRRPKAKPVPVKKPKKVIDREAMLAALAATPPPPVRQPRAVGGRVDALPAEPGVSRLDGGSECRECGKWLPGERSLCGRCSVLRDKRR